MFERLELPASASVRAPIACLSGWMSSLWQRIVPSNAKPRGSDVAQR